ncbi:hypothetical protein SAMN05216388_10336 [Halorientalis persicus]|uniref:DUF7982 domain-containing protein n=1 Tax=Halorientalis persicus TaxID=1367881 RepID=A0A1H8V3P5_9EURY|nr:hypothetical protein [Halorientalis persicus]SEP10120.1 hypothetical protein SAMN05216388_10336 [Halorientalis persicus]
MSADTPTDLSETPSDPPEESLAAEVEVLREENRRLREEFARARRTQYRRTALMLAGIGVLAGIAGVLFADARTVLFALSGTGVFFGVLVYYLSPEQFISADVGRRVYEALAQNEAAAVSELGLQNDRVYVSVGDAIEDARLFVPQRDEYELPAADALADTFVVPDEQAARGVALEPTGGPLAADFRQAATGDVDDTPEIATALSNALVEQFELVESADADVDPDAGRATVGVTESVYGPVDRFDHPVTSLLAVGLASALDTAVTTEVSTGDDRVDYLVTCQWESDG